MGEICPISKLSEGQFASIRGVVQAQPSLALRAPYSGKRCSYYKCVVDQDLSFMWDELLSEARVSQQIWIEDDSGIAQIDLGKSVPRVVGAPSVYPVGYLSSAQSIHKILAARQIRSAGDVSGFRCAETVVCSGDEIEVSGVVKLVPWENQRPEGDPYRCAVDIVPIIAASKGEEIEIRMISTATKSLKWS